MPLHAVIGQANAGRLFGENVYLAESSIFHRRLFRPTVLCSEKFHKIEMAQRATSGKDSICKKEERP